MIRTKRILEFNQHLYVAEEKAMKRLNQFICENKIERSNILELRTKRDNACKSYIDKFEVVISWWE